MAEVSQEEYFEKANMHDVIWRGIKKVMVELTSIKTLFLAFLCVAGWFGKITDTWLIVGGLAVLGVKEIPTELFTAIINKFTK